MGERLKRDLNPTNKPGKPVEPINPVEKPKKPENSSEKYCNCDCAWCEIGGHCRKGKCHM
jgi:hypothetical protein